jgi:hypothetical protein
VEGTCTRTGDTVHGRATDALLQNMSVVSAGKISLVSAGGGGNMHENR